MADVGVCHGRLTYATKAVRCDTLLILVLCLFPLPQPSNHTPRHQRHIYSAVENYWSLDPEHVPYPPNDDDDEDEVPVVEAAAAAATVAAAAPEPSTEGGDGGDDEGDATASGKTKELTEAERYAKVATAVDGLAASVETDMLREAVFEVRFWAVFWSAVGAVLRAFFGSVCGLFLGRAACARPVVLTLPHPPKYILRLCCVGVRWRTTCSD